MKLFSPRTFLAFAALAALGALVVVIGGASAGTQSAAAGRAVVQLRSTGLGKVLTDSAGRTLYLFEKDKAKTSSCYGSCASFWPSVLTSGKPTASGGPKAGLLGTTKRRNGQLQVTYAGHPLYRFALDRTAGQTKGEGLDDFGAHWYAVSSAGKKVGAAGASDSSGSSGSTTTTPYGGYGG